MVKVKREKRKNWENSGIFIGGLKKEFLGKTGKISLDIFPFPIPSRAVCSPDMVIAKV